MLRGQRGVVHDRTISAAIVIRLSPPGPSANQEDKMEWVIALIVLMIVPLGIVLWWIPHYDAIGVQRTTNRIAQESAGALTITS
jgi:hypothetical protein